MSSAHRSEPCNQPWGTGGKFQQSISWMCAFTSLLKCECPLWPQTPHPARVTWGSAGQDVAAGQLRSSGLPRAKAVRHCQEQTAAFGAAKAPQLFSRVHLTDCCSKLPDKEVSAV